MGNLKFQYNMLEHWIQVKCIQGKYLSKHKRNADLFTLDWLFSPMDSSPTKPRGFLRMFDRARRPASTKV